MLDSDKNWLPASKTNNFVRVVVAGMLACTFIFASLPVNDLTRFITPHIDKQANAKMIADITRANAHSQSSAHLLGVVAACFLE